ncbi:histone-like nucleoid-structuring protein Lsr2 [Nakamurella endophytica]|uniref:Lsr2 family protein n=1 Tax=Nakamurella endophytica TaxID=1748367 RepID=A0A917TBK4_9ACTN|nr:Lsr2 family protein [Nakamurella endophytica]GGM16265.1 Lsr2 family protein [Nakamurella endophytica]
MGTREIQFDDIDQSEADVTTVEFTFEGASYSIDLGEKNVEKFRDAMATYISHARRIDRSSSQSTAGRRRRPSGTAVAPVDREQIQAMRQWAKDNGYGVSDRGRIAASIQDAYHAAHSS